MLNLIITVPHGSCKGNTPMNHSCDSKATEAAIMLNASLHRTFVIGKSLLEIENLVPRTILDGNRLESLNKTEFRRHVTGFLGSLSNEEIHNTLYVDVHSFPNSYLRDIPYYIIDNANSAIVKHFFTSGSKVFLPGLSADGKNLNDLMREATDVGIAHTFLLEFNEDLGPIDLGATVEEITQIMKVFFFLNKKKAYT
jgi:hypothetical protein